MFAAAKGHGKPVSQVRVRPPLLKPENIICMAVNYMEDGTLPEPAPMNACSGRDVRFIARPRPDPYVRLCRCDKMMAGVDMLHVPYRGATPITSIEHVRAGKLRPLAVTARRRPFLEFGVVNRSSSG